MLPACQPAVYILHIHILSTAFSMAKRVIDVRINPLDDTSNGIPDRLYVFDLILGLKLSLGV